MSTGGFKARSTTSGSSFAPRGIEKGTLPDAVDTRTDGGSGGPRTPGRVLRQSWHRHTDLGRQLRSHRYRSCPAVRKRDADRKSVVAGKIVSVRVNIGGRRYNKKKT